MKKKVLGLIAALMLVCVGTAAADAAVGLQGGYNAGASGSAGVDLTFKVSNLDAVFAANLGIGNSQIYSVGVTADWWAQNAKLAGMVHYYWGPGVSVGLYDFNAIGFYAAFRAVLGVNVFVIDPLELYAQAAWQPGVYIHDGGVNFELAKFPINFGFRFWF